MLPMAMGEYSHMAMGTRQRKGTGFVFCTAERGIWPTAAMSHETVKMRWARKSRHEATPEILE